MRRSNIVFSTLVIALIGFAGCGKSVPTGPVPPAELPPETEAVAEDEAPATGDENPQEAQDATVETSEETADESASADSETGTLKIRFQYAGGPVEREPLRINQDASFCGEHDLRDEKLIVNEENNGLRNVVVYVYTGRGGSELPPMPPRNATVKFANENCRFEPHIGLAQVGDTLLATNPDPIGHNFNISFFNNKAENLSIPAGGQAEVEIKMAEPAPIPIDCNIHPWMKGYVVVLDHPYVGLSDENGDLTIEGLPVGENLVFRAFHEAGAIGEVTIDGETVEWKRSRFEREIQPGVDDMGVVVVPEF